MTTLEELKSDLTVALKEQGDYSLWEDVLEAVNGKIVRDEFYDDSHRWYTMHELIFATSGKHWRMIYRKPATEMQEIDMYDKLDDIQSLVEVEPYEKTITEYRKV